ncbi:MAG: PAS domain S-box protein [Acidobacteriota bacterium]|nr:PAS domain S-box protein [Acidobacteriota bacterium]
MPQTSSLTPSGDSDVAPGQAKPAEAAAPQPDASNSTGSASEKEGPRRGVSGPSRSEEAVSEGETRFRTIFENSGSGIALVDMQGHPVKSNPALQKILGYTEEELSGMVFTEFTHADDQELDWGLYRELIAGKRDKYEIEKRFITKDGRVIWGSLIVTLVRDAEGVPKYAVGMVQDITERKQAEDELRRISERLRLATRAANIGIWDWDVARDEVVWDDAMYGLYGIRKEDTGNAFEAWSKSLAPEESEQAHAELQAALRGERGFAYEFRIVWPDGSVHFIKADSQTFHDEEGRPVRMVGVNYDITERKRAEEALREANSKLELILNTSPLPITSADADGRITSWNKAAERLFGWTAEEAVGRVCPTIPPAQTEEYVGMVRKAMQGETYVGLVHYRQKKNGSLLTCSVSAAPQRNARGEPVGVTIIVEDITERKQAEEALRESRQLLRLVLATLPVGVIVTDQAGDIVLTNAAAKRIWGNIITSGRQRWAQSRGFWHDSGERVAPTAWASVRALSEGQTRLNELIDIESYDAQRKTIENSAAPVRNAEGLIVGAVIVNKDVTERVRAEEALRRSEESFRKAFEASPAPGVIIRSLDRQYLNVNDAFVRTFGYTAEEAIGKSSAELGIWPGNREREAFWQKLWEKKSIKGYETRIHNKSGEMMDVLLYAEAIEMSGEQCFMASIIDITERKQAEEELKASSAQLRALSESLRKAKEEEGIRIARELHDELGAALTSLKWSLTRLREDCSGGANAGGGGDTQSKIGEMVSLVNATINTVRRISSELRPGVLEDLGLIPAIEWHAHQAQANTGIVCRFESQVENVGLSRERATTVFRIFQEAMTNVLRHAGATRVNILVEEDDDEFVLEVSDNGRGITDSEKLGTSALGLLGMRERAHSVGGRVEINGTPGKGTTLIVRVPLPADGRM